MYLHKRQKRIIYFALFIILLLTTGTTASLEQFIPPEIQKIIFAPTISPIRNSDKTVANQSTPAVYDVKVIRVVDGDTIVIENGLKLRYIGINTPESVDPRRPVECFAKEASARNKTLVEGKTIRLEKDISETDRSKRLLRYVYVDNIMVNETLVREGYAYASSYPPDIKYQERLKTAEQEARENNRGLWGSCEIKNQE